MKEWFVKYEKQGRISSFEFWEDEAILRLPSGKEVQVFVFADNEYIVGETVIMEAARSGAKYLICNNWGEVGQSAAREANRLGIEIYDTEEFGRKLDELNAGA